MPPVLEVLQNALELGTDYLFLHIRREDVVEGDDVVTNTVEQFGARNLGHKIPLDRVTKVFTNLAFLLLFVEAVVSQNFVHLGSLADRFTLAVIFAGAQIGREDDRCLSEEHCLPAAVGQSPVVKDLQEDVHNFRVSFFDFVEKDNGEGTFAHCIYLMRKCA